ncbi:AMP-binding protein [Alkalihalophilus marmarensis]|uniref:AMP-binding protein n=1 Tax=Alkalihalophilus marmarensis TaxID=521377 RepID=UPI002DBBF96E|nr:AMP-binding protein [Alkalihalophilus marmarensis]MEC2071937.1 AMP-binding protein [Alkalihalophilus marmarensis]
MFYVNDTYYSHQDLDEQFKVFDQLDYLKECDRHRIAVCHEDTFILLALYFYIKKKGGSVAPIHAKTPLEAARRTADHTKSHYLIHHDIESPIQLKKEGDNHSGSLIQLSSGTTGEPKCIERSWSSIDRELENYNVKLSINMVTTSIVACPVNHSYGLISGVLAAMKRGSVPVIITNPNPKYIVKKLKEYPVHILYAAPTLLYTLSRLLPIEERFYAVMTSGTLLPDAWFRLLQKKSQRVLQQYGCSEAGCVSVNANVSEANSIGKVLSHLDVTSGQGKENPEEILIKIDKQTIQTKDLGYFDEQGTLHFLERIDEMINVAGLNVYPHEVENIIRSYKGIQDTVVFKKRDDYAGERVCALYSSEEEIDPINLRQWCQQNLAPYQVPVEWVRVKKVDRMANGKVSRKKLGGVYA